MEMEVRSLEADRLQRREVKKSSNHGHRHHRAAYAAVEVTVSDDSESDQSSSEEEPDAFEYLIQQAAMAQKKYGQKTFPKNVSCRKLQSTSTRGTKAKVRLPRLLRELL